MATVEQIATIVGPTWAEKLLDEFHQQYLRDIFSIVKEERKKYQVAPEHENMFRALRETPYDKVRVVIVGQDPYPTPGDADGLAFSARNAGSIPVSLRNIFKELESDVGFKDPEHNSDLTRWAKQGVLLLNTSLTTRVHASQSHSNIGWDKFTYRVLEIVAERFFPTIFVAWGVSAKQVVSSHINPFFHTLIESAHPSPRSCHRGFFGSKPFSRINEALSKMPDEPLIDWYKA